MKLTGGMVFCPDHQMHRQDLCFENGVITERSADGTLDVSGCYVLPGLIDTHLHGARGVSFYWSDDDLRPALDWLASRGVTGVLPTTVCETPEELEHDLHRLARISDDRVLGIHTEGPFLNPAKNGGMLPDRIQKPSVETLQRIIDAGEGKIKVMTLAPEMEGADQLIDRCLEAGIRVSMGHTDADFETARRAIDKGASRLTHTFNAMRGLHHREPGVLGCALTDDRVTCELICDLYHVSAPMIRLAIRAKGADRVTMISDSSAFAGLPDGVYSQNGQEVYIRDGHCTLEDGTIFCSSLCLSDGAKNLFRMGFSPEQIAIMAAVNPAKLCGCTDRGEFTIGARADITVFDAVFDVKAVVVKGIRKV